MIRRFGGFMCVMLVTGFWAAQATAQPDIDWEYLGNLATDITPGCNVDGWHVQMYRSNHGASLAGITFNGAGIPGGAGAGDDLLAFSTTTSGTPPVFETFIWTGWDGTSLNGDLVYTVLFDAPSIAAAGNAVILDATAQLVPDQASFPYSIPVTLNSWQPIPEPGVWLLLAAGAATVLAQRRLRRKGN